MPFIYFMILNVNEDLSSIGTLLTHLMSYNTLYILDSKYS